MFPPQEQGRKAEHGVQWGNRDLAQPSPGVEEEPPTMVPGPPGVCERLYRTTDSGPEIVLPSSSPDEPTLRENSVKELPEKHSEN